MAKRIEGVTEKLLQCAKEEFLTNGYENASLRVIAEKAGYTKGVVYIRYRDKESLFQALVQPAADGLHDLLSSILSSFGSMPEKKQQEQVFTFSDDGFPLLVGYIYDHFDEFRLLLTCAPGTMYQDFLEDLVALDMECTKHFLQEIGSPALASGRITDGFLHVVSSAFYAGVFEIVIHDMPQADAENYIHELRTFFSNGWKSYY